ncbi:MAG: aminotransferase class V-fold PLP-dependent enzyme [Adlercreutzia equolifaciens]
MRYRLHLRCRRGRRRGRLLGLVQAAAEQRRLAGQDRHRPASSSPSPSSTTPRSRPLPAPRGRGACSPPSLVLRPNRTVGFIDAPRRWPRRSPTARCSSPVQARRIREVGAIQPIRELAALAHERGALFHTDAVQALGKMLLEPAGSSAWTPTSFLPRPTRSRAAPRRVGALYLKARTPFAPYLLGGGQES